jgi:hypothetical protein
MFTQLAIHYLYREDFYFVDWFHSSALHSNQCAACCEAHVNFADESACLMADNVRNEVLTSAHRTQEVLKKSLCTCTFLAPGGKMF